MAHRTLIAAVTFAAVGLAFVDGALAFNMHVPKSVLVDPIRTGSILTPRGAPDEHGSVCVPSEMPTNAVPALQRAPARGLSNAQ